jgi:hypothetical protein
MKRRASLFHVLVAEARVQLARTPEAREEAAADVVVTKFVSGFRITEADALALQRSLATADAKLKSVRKVA